VVKRVRVKLFGHQNRSVVVDSHATEGAVVGKDVRWPDGTLVDPGDLGGSSDPVDLPQVMPTLWSLILDIPAKLLGLLALTDTGYVYHENDVFTIGTGGFTDWPLHKDFIGAAETLIITENFQYLIAETFDVEGTLDAEGMLAIL
jgi:hypothetical protein